MRVYSPEQRVAIATAVDRAMGGRGPLRLAARAVAKSMGVSEWSAIKFFYQLQDNRSRRIDDPLHGDSAFVRGSQKVNDLRRRRYHERLASDPEFASRQKRLRTESHQRMYRPYTSRRADGCVDYFCRKVTAFARMRAKRDGELELFHITPQHLLGLWQEQQGLCAVSGLAMDSSLPTRHPLVPSLDRIDPSRGYAEDNVRFVAYFINLMKRDFTDCEVRRIIATAHTGAEAGPLPDPQQLLPKMHASIRNALRRSKERQWAADLSIERLWELYEQQRGRCALSGVILTGQPLTAFSLSIDRIDSSKGYSAGNIQLVCLSVNMGKLHHDGELFTSVLARAGLQDGLQGAEQAAPAGDALGDGLPGEEDAHTDVADAHGVPGGHPPR